MAEDPTKEKKVTLTQTEFNKLLDTIEKLSSGQKTLFDVADKSRLARHQVMSGEALIRTAKVSIYDGKYVLGWKLTKNVSEIMPGTGRWVEDQATMLIFEDGETQEIPLIDFYRKIVKESGEIVNQTDQIDEATKKKVTIFTIELKTGKQINIDNRFVN